MGLVAKVVNKIDGKRYVISTARNPYGVWETAVFEANEMFLPLDQNKPLLVVNASRDEQAKEQHARTEAAFETEEPSELVRYYELEGALPFGQLLYSESQGNSGADGLKRGVKEAEGGMKDDQTLSTLATGMASGVLRSCSPHEAEQIRKSLRIDKSYSSFGEELFFLYMFLFSYACQTVFKDDSELAHRILDRSLGEVFVRRHELPPQLRRAVTDDAVSESSLIKNKFEVYYEAIRSDGSGFDFTAVGNEFLYALSGFRNKTIGSVEDVRREHTRRWGESLGIVWLWVGSMLNELMDEVTALARKSGLR